MRTHRSNFDELELLTGRECDWCGGTQVWWQYAKPHFNPTTLGGRIPAVVFGRWVCTNYGACENAPG